MNQFLKRSITLLAISIFLFIFAGACDKDMNIMLDDSATSEVGVSFQDSFTVHTASTQLTDLPSAATGTVLIGKATLPQIGSVRATSYFRIGFPSFANDIPETAQFDSLNIILKPNARRYYFGDSTKTQTLYVHQLNEDLALKTLTTGLQNKALPIYVTGPSLFTDQTFSYNSTPLGSKSFNPRIKTMDTLAIRLSDQVGQNLFGLIKTGDPRVSSNENFANYFKGLALVPDASNTVAIGFSDTVDVKINYSYVGNDGFKKTGAKVLSLMDPNYQYNQIGYDRTGTAFASLAPGKAVKTSATGGLTYVQAGTGVVAKLNIPSLKEFLQDENMSINKAELVIETSSTGEGMYAIPGSLMLFVANDDGVPTSFIASPYASGIQQAAYVMGSEVGHNGTYTFNMIVYLKNLKSSGLYDHTSLYLSTVTPSLFNAFNTALIATENGNPSIKLNILYTKFK